MTEYKTAEQVIARINSSIDWYNKSYAGYLFGIDEQAIGIAHATKNPIALPFGFIFYNITKPHHWEWFWDNQEIKKKRASILSTAIKDSNFAEGFLKKWEKEFSQFLNAYNSGISQDLHSASNNTLKKIIKNIHDYYIKNGGFGYIVDSFLTSDKEDWLILRIKEELKEKSTSEVIAVLTQPTFGSFVSEYESGLVKIAKMISDNKSKKEIDSACTSLSKRFEWIKSNYFDKFPLSEKEVLQEAHVLVNKKIDLDLYLQEKEHGVEHNIKAKKEIYKKLDVSKELQSIIRISEVFTHIQDKRKERVLRSNYLHFKLLDEIARKFSKSQTVCYYLTPDEAISLLSGKNINWEEIERRSKEEFMKIYFNGKSVILYKKEIDKLINKKNIFHENKDIREFRGAIAFKGLVKGKAYVLRNSKDISVFPEGNILVANQTTPEFVPAMKKAIAVITDQGGITCHAAIVSRELKKPCVIGTKIATKVLKDGDYIEVDADKGIVRIIK